jgi:S-layer protein (TIGR01567 family)
MSDRTYYYTRDIGDAKDIVTIAIHFKNIFRDSDIQIATVDGEFQISDNATPLKPGQQYGKMSIRNVNPTDYTITMDNKDNQLTLSKNKDMILMQNMYLRTADQDNITIDHPLRYYIYKKYTEPGIYQLRGSTADTSRDVFTWDNSTFSGFYYDINKNLGTEQLTFRLTNKNSTSATLSDQEINGTRGIVYTTTAQNKDFEFKPWGQYKVIGFLGDRYFAAYTDTVTLGMKDANESVALLYDISRNRNLMTNEQISKVLMDDNEEKAMTIDSPLKLGEGYQLAIKNVNAKGDKAYVELFKNGEIVDSKIVQPSIENAKMSDKTYYYKVDLGDTREIVQIAVHFKNITRSAGKDKLIVDGIFQISDSPVSVIAGQPYGQMFVNEVDPIALTIKMDNKYWKIVLRKNKDTMLMGNISIYAADQIEISNAYPLRYYIYKTEIIESSA